MSNVRPPEKQPKLFIFFDPTKLIEPQVKTKNEIVFRVTVML